MPIPKRRGSRVGSAKSVTVSVHFLPQFLVPHERGELPASRKIGDVLVRALSERQSKSPRYSLRAFAQRLGVDSATLSQIIRGRRFVSARSAETLATRLQCTTLQCAAVAGEARRAAHRRRVLGLVARGGVAPVVRQIARRLRLTKDEINVALTALLIRGILKMKCG